MARTLDHWICPKCKNNFRTVGSIDPEDEKCKKCGEQMECWACGEWSDEGICRCLETVPECDG